MNNVFLDTNIILDLILKRSSFDKNYFNISLELINKCLYESCSMYVSIISLNDVFYITSKLAKGQEGTAKRQHIKQKINNLLKLVNPVITTQKAFYDALESDFKDFEDALQYFTACENDISFIITRNKKDFVFSEIPVYTPYEFLNLPVK